MMLRQRPCALRQQLCPVAECMLGLQACSAAQVIKKQLTEGVTQRRVGLVSTGAPPRAHSLILNQEGKEVRLPQRCNQLLEHPAGPVPGCLDASKIATHPQSKVRVSYATALSDICRPILQQEQVMATPTAVRASAGDPVICCADWGDHQRSLQPMPEEECGDGLRGEEVWQGRHITQGLCARPGEPGRGVQDAIRTQHLLQGAFCCFIGRPAED